MHADGFMLPPISPYFMNVHKSLFAKGWNSYLIGKEPVFTNDWKGDQVRSGYVSAREFSRKRKFPHPCPTDFKFIPSDKCSK